MPRGYWDWGVNPTGLLTPSDIAAPELAARLGSIDRYERMGEVIFLDSFEHGLSKWNQEIEGTGAAITLITAAARSGGYAVQLKTGSDAGRMAVISRPQPFLANGRFGFEFSAFMVIPGQTLTLSVDIYTSTQLQRFGLRYDPQNLLLLRRNSSGAWVTLASGFYLYVGTGLWHSLKLVVDSQTGKYGRASVNSSRFDLSTIDGQVTTNDQGARMDVLLTHIGRSGFNDVIDVDDVIITQNEP